MTTERGETAGLSALANKNLSNKLVTEKRQKIKPIQKVKKNQDYEEGQSI